MKLLEHLLNQDPAAPRLTVYNESSGARLDFSAITLDNWAAKVGNMLLEEFDLESGDSISIDLPVSWQAVAIALGALAADVNFSIGIDEDSSVLFTAPVKDAADAPSFSGDVVLVTDDPFGRGVVESGGTVPQGMVDFGPTVRFYGDQFYYPTKTLGDAIEAISELSSDGAQDSARYLTLGWQNTESFIERILTPLACGGSVVVVAGMVSQDRLEKIAEAEHATKRI